MGSGRCSCISALVLFCVSNVETDSFTALALHSFNHSVIQSQIGLLSSTDSCSSATTGSNFWGLHVSECMHACLCACKTRWEKKYKGDINRETWPDRCMKTESRQGRWRESRDCGNDKERSRNWEEEFSAEFPTAGGFFLNLSTKFHLSVVL